MSGYLNTLNRLAFKDFTPQQNGKGRISGLSSISRQLYKSLCDGYRPHMSRQLATTLKRYVNTRPKHERKSPEFVGEIRRKIVCLHEYNLQIAKVKCKYPRSEHFDAVLMQYIELECGLLYDTYKEVDNKIESDVTQRVLRLLRVIVYDSLQNSEISQKATIEACDKILLKLFANIRDDYIKENKLVANAIVKLLQKLNLLDEVNKLKGKSVSFQHDTYLKDPLVSSIRQTLATSDYESDVDGDEDDEDATAMIDETFGSTKTPFGFFSHLKEKSKNDDFGFGSRFGESNIPTPYSMQEVQMEFSNTSRTNKQNSSQNDVHMDIGEKLMNSGKTPFTECNFTLSSQKINNHNTNDVQTKIFLPNGNNLQKGEAQNVKLNSSNYVPFVAVCKNENRRKENDFFPVTETSTDKRLTNSSLFSKNGKGETFLEEMNSISHVKETNQKSLKNDDLSKVTHNKENNNVILSHSKEPTKNSTDTATSKDKNYKENISQVEVSDLELIEAESASSKTTMNIQSVKSEIEEVQSNCKPRAETCNTNSTNDVIVDLDNISNSWGNRKSQVTENTNCGIITIELLDDDDEDVGVTSNANEGTSQSANNPFVNLLQSTEIKQEENEENRSPNFPVPNTDNNEPNILSSDKNARNSSSSEFSKTDKTSKDSAKESDSIHPAIVISDSEDEVLDAPSKCHELQDIADTLTKHLHGSNEEVFECDEIPITEPSNVCAIASCVGSQEADINKQDSELKDSTETDVNQSSFRGEEITDHEEAREKLTSISVKVNVHSPQEEDVASILDKASANDLRQEEIATISDKTSAHYPQQEVVAVSDKASVHDRQQKEVAHILDKTSCNNSHQEVAANIADKASAYDLQQEELVTTLEKVGADDPQQNEIAIISDIASAQHLQQEGVGTILGKDSAHDPPQEEIGTILDKASAHDSLHEVIGTILDKDSSHDSPQETLATISDNIDANKSHLTGSQTVLDVAHDGPSIVEEENNKVESPAVVQPDDLQQFTEVQIASTLYKENISVGTDYEQLYARNRNDDDQKGIVTLQTEVIIGEVHKVFPDAISAPTTDCAKIELPIPYEVTTISTTIGEEIELPLSHEIVSQGLDDAEIVEEEIASVTNETFEHADIGNGKTASREFEQSNEYRNDEVVQTVKLQSAELSDFTFLTENTSEMSTEPQEFVTVGEEVVETSEVDEQLNIESDKENIESNFITNSSMTNITVDNQNRDDEKLENQELHEDVNVEVYGKETCNIVVEPLSDLGTKNMCEANIPLTEPRESVGIVPESSLVNETTIITINEDVMFAAAQERNELKVPSSILDNDTTNGPLNEHGKVNTVEDVQCESETNASTFDASAQKKSNHELQEENEKHIAKSDVSCKNHSEESTKDTYVSQDIITENTLSTSIEPQGQKMSPNIECVQEVCEAMHYSMPAECATPIKNSNFNEQPSETKQFYRDCHNVAVYEKKPHLQGVVIPVSDEPNIITTHISEANVPQTSENDAALQEPVSFYTPTSKITEVHYDDYGSEKKVGDLELLANIAADQETLAVKTESGDTASEAESITKLSIPETTPRRRKSKVKFDCKKRSLPREILPRAVKQFPRRHPLKQKINVEEEENKRITRNVSIHSKMDTGVLKETQKQLRATKSEDPKYKPHDFISLENSILPPRTNNVYAQKRLMDANTTSEDSNDSCESSLFIDLEEKKSESVFEEETICEMWEFVRTEDKDEVCISIPENEENCVTDNFAILSQMEDFVDNNNQKPVIEKTEKINPENTILEKTNIVINDESPKFLVEHTTEDATSQLDADDSKTIKTTDHSIENILNKTALNGVKVASQAFHIETDLQLSKSAVNVESESLEPPKLNVEKENQESTCIERAEDRRTKTSKLNENSITEVDKEPLAEKQTSDKNSIAHQPCKEVENIATLTDTEKIFKTKAAMKSYEDKLQPNPYVLLHNFETINMRSQELGIRTRLRSKSSEEAKKRNVATDRIRSSSVDCKILFKDPKTLFRDSKLESPQCTTNASEPDKTETVLKVDFAPTEQVLEGEEVESCIAPDMMGIEDVPSKLELSPISDTSLSESCKLVTESNKLLEIDEEINKPEDLAGQIIDFEKDLDNNEEVISEDKKETAIEKSAEVKETTTAPNEENISTSTFLDVVEVTVPFSSSLQARTENLESVQPEEALPGQSEEPVVTLPKYSTLHSKKHSEKNVSEKAPKSSKVSGEAKGRSLENTIKKMKEKIEESEKAKKEEKTGELEKTKNHSPKVLEANLEPIHRVDNVAVQADEVQLSKEKSDPEKKQTKKNSSEDVKQKSLEFEKNDTKKIHSGSTASTSSEGPKQKSSEPNRHDSKKVRSRSPSKSRSLEKKMDSSTDKDRSVHKFSRRSRSSSKSRSLEKKRKHHSDNENDRKVRSASKSFEDKDKNSGSLENPNGHKKRCTRSPTKSLDGKSKRNSSERSSSKYKMSENKDKTSGDEKRDYHKNRSSKSPPKTKLLEAKEKQPVPEKKIVEEKEKSKNKNEEVKNKVEMIRLENKCKMATEEHCSSPTDRIKLQLDNSSKDIPIKVEHKPKSRKYSKPQESNSTKVDHQVEKIEEKLNEKQIENQKTKTTLSKSSDAQKTTNDKDKHRDAHRTKSKEKRETKPVTEIEKRSDTPQKEDQSKNKHKSRRSHSKEKSRVDNGSRSDKRDKNSKERRSKKTTEDAKENMKRKEKTKEDVNISAEDPKSRAPEIEQTPNSHLEENGNLDKDRKLPEITFTIIDESRSSKDKVTSKKIELNVKDSENGRNSDVNKKPLDLTVTNDATIKSSNLDKIVATKESPLFEHGHVDNIVSTKAPELGSICDTEIRPRSVNRNQTKKPEVTITMTVKIDAPTSNKIANKLTSELSETTGSKIKSISSNDKYKLKTQKVKKPEKRKHEERANPVVEIKVLHEPLPSKLVKLDNEKAKKENTSICVQPPEPLKSTNVIEATAPKEDFKTKKSTPAVEPPNVKHEILSSTVKGDLIIPEDLSFNKFTKGIEQTSDKILAQLENEKQTEQVNTIVPNIQETLDEPIITKDASPQSDDMEICETGVSQTDLSEEDINNKTDLTTSVIAIDESIPSTASVYNNTIFNSSQNMDVQVLATLDGSKVKHLPGQGADLSLLPIMSTSMTTDCTTVSTVSMSCGVTSVGLDNGSSCNVRAVPEKTCFFTYQDAESVNRENLNGSEIFHTQLGLDDISPTKLPLASNQSLDFISPSTSMAEITNPMNLVQTLGTSSINFEVPDTSEIAIQQTSKQSTFCPNFVTRVTEISCFEEKESTADHNYTLGDPLLGGNHEDKNILTTGLSLTDPEFQLNESHLDELSFNENTFIEENGTLEELGLLPMACKKEKPDFDNIMDDAIPKPEEIQNSIRQLNMLLDSSQSGEPKPVSVGNTLNHTSIADSIDYAVSEVLFLRGGKGTSQSNSFSNIQDIEIMETPTTTIRQEKQSLEDSPPEMTAEETVLPSVCSSYSNLKSSENRKVVVEPVEQYSIISVDQLKKDYIDNSKNDEKTKPAVKSNAPTVTKPIHRTDLMTFLESAKREENKNDNLKVKDEMEKYTMRRHHRTPVYPPKKKNVTQQQHTKSPPENKKTEILLFETHTANKTPMLSSHGSKEGRIRVKTDLIKSTDSKMPLTDPLSTLEYINEYDQNLASEVVIPFSRPSPLEHKTEEKKPAEAVLKTEPVVTKHARFDKKGNDYVMENILNVCEKSPISEVRNPDKLPPKKVDVLDLHKKRKLNDSEIRPDEKRPKKPDDEEKNRKSDTKTHAKKSDSSTSNNKPSTDDIFDQLKRKPPINICWTEQNSRKEGHSNSNPETPNNRGYSKVPDLHRREKNSPPQTESAHAHDSRHKDSRYQKKTGYFTSNSNVQLNRKTTDRTHISVPIIDPSPKGNYGNSYNSKSDPGSNRDVKLRDRRMSTEQVNNYFPISTRTRPRQDEDKFSWIAKFSDAGIMDTPNLFPGSTGEDTSSRK